MAGWTVEVTGLRRVYDALNEIDKSAVREINKRITNAAKDVAAAASYITPHDNPISNWGSWTASRSGRDLSYSGDVASGGFKPRRSNYRKRGVSRGIGWDVYQTNAGAAIFELVGSGSGQFVETVANRFRGKRPRSLIPAYYEGMPDGLADSIRDQILDDARKAGLV